MSRFILLSIAFVGGCVSTGEETQVATRGFLSHRPNTSQLTPRQEGLVLVGYLNESSDLVAEIQSRYEVRDTMAFNSSCLDRLAELRQQGHVSIQEFQTASFGYMEAELALFDSQWTSELINNYTLTPKE